MKSKSFDSKQSAHEHAKENRSFDFATLYKSAAETKTQFDTNDVTKVAKKVKVPDVEQDNMSKRSRSPNKHKKKKFSEMLDSSVIAAGHSPSGTMTTTPTKKPNVTSTPKAKTDKSESNVKSIMKNKSDLEVSINVSKVISSGGKPKKRNKSVSFMLEEGDEVIVKKSKSNDSAKDVKNKEKTSKKLHKDKKNWPSKQETKIPNKDSDNQIKAGTLGTLAENLSDRKVLEVRIKLKKAKKFRPPEGVQKTEDVAGDQSSDNKSRKSKKKKRKAKALQDTNAEAEDEPAVKSRKKELKTETIAKGLENLNIGDNAYTLSHLLDEMSVVDKNKKKKEKQHKDNQKNNKPAKTKPEQHKDSYAEIEKVKWSHRKWNKDTKGEANKPKLQNSVVVENLPINFMFSYKPVLSEHFAKFGTIAGIGVAETYPNEDPQPVFTTTIFFQTEESATKALEDDNAILAGNGVKSRIRVRRALPPTQTTLVVRAYAELSQQALSSLFASAGRIRSIRHLVKGKKTIATAFVEFDGPDAVERALKLAQDAKINGKKMYVAKYEHRVHRKKERDGDNTIATD